MSYQIAISLYQLNKSMQYILRKYCEKNTKDWTDRSYRSRAEGFPDHYSVSFCCLSFIPNCLLPCLFDRSDHSHILHSIEIGKTFHRILTGFHHPRFRGSTLINKPQLSSFQFTRFYRSVETVQKITCRSADVMGGADKFLDRR